MDSANYRITQEQDTTHAPSQEELNVALKVLPEAYRDRLLRSAALKHPDVFQDTLQHHSEQRQLRRYRRNFEVTRTATRFAISDLEKGGKDVTAIENVVKDIDAKLGGIRDIALAISSFRLSRVVKKYALMALVGILDTVGERKKRSALRSVVYESIKSNKVWYHAMRELLQGLDLDNTRNTLLEEPEINERTRQFVDKIRGKDVDKNRKTATTVLLGKPTPKDNEPRDTTCKIERCIKKPKEKVPSNDNIVDLESSEEESPQQGTMHGIASLDEDLPMFKFRRRVTGLGSCSNKVVEEQDVIKSRRQGRNVDNEMHRVSADERDMMDLFGNLEPKGTNKYKKLANIHPSIDTDYHHLPDYAPVASVLDKMHPEILIHASNARSPLNLSNDQDRHLLYTAEVKLASVLRISCATYLCSKRRIFRGRLQALKLGKDFNKRDAQKVCKIANDKATELWTAFEGIGWFNKKHFLQYLNSPRDTHGINPVNSTKRPASSQPEASSPIKSRSSLPLTEDGAVGLLNATSPLDAPPPESPGSEYLPESNQITPLIPSIRGPRRSIATSRPYRLCRDQSIKNERTSIETILKHELDDLSEPEIQPAKRHRTHKPSQFQVCVPDSQVMSTPQCRKLKDKQDTTLHIKSEKGNEEPKKPSGDVYRLGRLFFEKEDNKDDELKPLGLASSTQRLEMRDLN